MRATAASRYELMGGGSIITKRRELTKGNSTCEQCTHTKRIAHKTKFNAE